MEWCDGDSRGEAARCDAPMVRCGAVWRSEARCGAVRRGVVRRVRCVVRCVVRRGVVWWCGVARRGAWRAVPGVARCSAAHAVWRGARFGVRCRACRVARRGAWFGRMRCLRLAVADELGQQHDAAQRPPVGLCSTRRAATCSRHGTPPLMAHGHQRHTTPWWHAHDTVRAHGAVVAHGAATGVDRSRCECASTRVARGGGGGVLLRCARRRHGSSKI
eukprot:3267648-Prymnesium_polylepis.1